LFKKNFILPIQIGKMIKFIIIQNFILIFMIQMILSSKIKLDIYDAINF
jgi:hypothetical protein